MQRLSQNDAEVLVPPHDTLVVTPDTRTPQNAAPASGDAATVSHDPAQEGKRLDRIVRIGIAAVFLFLIAVGVPVFLSAARDAETARETAIRIQKRTPARNTAEQDARIMELMEAIDSEIAARATVQILLVGGIAAPLLATLLLLLWEREANARRRVSEQTEREIVRLREAEVRAGSERETFRLQRALDEERIRLSHVLSRALCVLWEGTVREIPRVDDPTRPPFTGPLFDEARQTVLYWQIEALNDDEAFARIPLPRTSGESFSEAMTQARLPEDTRIADQTARAALRNLPHRGDQGAWQQEWRVPKTSGEVCYLREAVQAECIEESDTGGIGTDSGMRVWRMVGLLIDVTAEKKAVETLYHSEKQLAEAQRRAGVGSWRWESATGVVTWSNEMYRMYGFPRDRTPHLEDVVARIAPHERETVAHVMEKCLRDGLPFRLEHTVVRPDGSEIHISVTGDGERDETGQIVALSGTGLDITALRNQLLANAALLEELSRSESRLRQVTRRARCLLWQADVWEIPADLRPEQHVGDGWVNINSETGEQTPLMLFRTPADAPGLPPTILDWHLGTVDEESARTWLPLADLEKPGVSGGMRFAEAWYWARPPDDRTRTDAAMQTLLQRMVQHGEIHARHSQEFRVRLASGAVRWLQEEIDIERVESSPESGTQPASPASGIPPLMQFRLVGVCTDVTAQKEIALALARSNQDLSEFASVASHDLQEPLRKIRTLSDLLVRRAGDKLGDSERQYIDRMQKAAERMQTLITDLLGYSRVTTGAKPFAPVDMNEIFRGVCEDLETRIERTGGEVRAETPLPILMADALQMRQLLQNLIGNALKYHRDDMRPIVRVCWTPDARIPESRGVESLGAAGDVLPPETTGGVAPETTSGVLSVHDNGMGFDMKYAERVFGVFERLEGRSSEREGTGVGLAIVRKIAERHSGTKSVTGTEKSAAVWCESEPGVGSVFYVRLGGFSEGHDVFP